MADQASDDEVRSKGRARGKRLARAKVRRPAPEAPKAAAPAARPAKASEPSKPASKASRTKERKARTQKIVIALFAVILAIGMVVPSLSTIVTNDRRNVEAEQDAAADATDETEDGSTSTGMDKVDENYTTTITPLEDKLKESPDDLATLLNLGNDYMSWAYDASSYATDDASQEHVNDLFEKAIEYFDKYLELNDSVAVKVSRAMCVYYSASADEGIDAMTAITVSNPEFAPAWGNLGLLYEQRYELDKAKETYQKAAEVDADDSYGVKSFANRRLASLNSSKVEQTSETLTSTTPTSIDTDTGSTLTNTLLNKTDTSF